MYKIIYISLFLSMKVLTKQQHIPRYSELSHNSTSTMCITRICSTILDVINIHVQ